MTELFLNAVNRSITAGILVLLIILLRLLFRKAPKWIHVLLWGLAAVRLICPFSFESSYSLMPKTDWIEQERTAYETVIEVAGVPDGICDADGSSSDADRTFPYTPPLQITEPSGDSRTVVILSRIWIAGIAVMILYLACSYLRVYRHIRSAEVFEGNIYTSETVASPFVFGWIRPRICLPEAMDAVNMSFVIAHEEAHIRRRDHWWKPLGFLLLSVCWFHPLLWLAYILFCRDIEMACDERVIKDYTDLQRADYSEALLECGVKRRTISACPPAFGEAGVKARVRSVLYYREPASLTGELAVAVCLAAAVCFLTDPITDDSLNSLYAEPEPVMEIRIWQRNEKETLDYPDIHPNHRFFYDVVPLKLKEGETVETSAVPRTVWNNTVLEILYDGDIRGQYDIAAENMIFYTGESDKIPANYGGGDGTVRMNDDGTFDGNRKMTLSIENLNRMFAGAILTGSNPMLSLFYEDDWRDSCKIERFHEVYPESMELGGAYADLQNLRRVVMTNYLTIQAMHPLKEDTPVATVVLEITTCSGWYGAEQKEVIIGLAFDWCDPDCNTGKVTVVSYEQSDFFAME